MKMNRRIIIRIRHESLANGARQDRREGNSLKNKFPKNNVIILVTTLLLASSVIYTSVPRAREITWQEFRNHYLRPRLPVRLIVDGKRVWVLRTDIYERGASSSDAEAFFIIGDTQTFEHRLEDVQNGLAIPEDSRVTVLYRDEHSSGSTFFHMFPTFILLGVIGWQWLKAGSSRSSGPGFLGIGKSRALIFNKGQSVSIRFKDVAGWGRPKKR